MEDQEFADWLDEILDDDYDPSDVEMAEEHARMEYGERESDEAREASPTCAVLKNGEVRRFPTMTAAQSWLKGQPRRLRAALVQGMAIPDTAAWCLAPHGSGEVLMGGDPPRVLHRRAKQWVPLPPA